MMTSKMDDKKAVTYTLFVNADDSEEMIRRKLLARRIKHLAFLQNEVMAAWAREIGVSRSAIAQVVSGKRATPRIRRLIEQKLGQQVWE